MSDFSSYKELRNAYETIKLKLKDRKLAEDADAQQIIKDIDSLLDKIKIKGDGDLEDDELGKDVKKSCIAINTALDNLKRKIEAKEEAAADHHAPQDDPDDNPEADEPQGDEDPSPVSMETLKKMQTSDVIEKFYSLSENIGNLGGRASQEEKDALMAFAKAKGKVFMIKSKKYPADHKFTNLSPEQQEDIKNAFIQLKESAAALKKTIDFSSLSGAPKAPANPKSSARANPPKGSGKRVKFREPLETVKTIEGARADDDDDYEDEEDEVDHELIDSSDEDLLEELGEVNKERIADLIEMLKTIKESTSASRKPQINHLITSLAALGASANPSPEKMQREALRVLRERNRIMQLEGIESRKIDIVAKGLDKVREDADDITCEQYLAVLESTAKIYNVGRIPKELHDKLTKNPKKNLHEVLTNRGVVDALNSRITVAQSLDSGSKGEAAKQFKHLVGIVANVPSLETREDRCARYGIKDPDDTEEIVARVKKLEKEHELAEKELVASLNEHVAGMKDTPVQKEMISTFVKIHDIERRQLEDPNYEPERPPILCIASSPGMAKTQTYKMFAECAGMPLYSIDMTAKGAFEVQGAQASFKDAKPGILGHLYEELGKIIKAQKAKMKSGRFQENGKIIVFLDEIEKAKPEAYDALLYLLERKSESARDNFLDVDLPLDNIVFVAAGNDLERLSGPCRARLNVVRMPDYTDEQKETIIKDKMLPNSLGPWSRFIKLSKEAMDYLLSDHVTEGGVREADSILTAISSDLVDEFLKKNESNAEITALRVAKGKWSRIKADLKDIAKRQRDGKPRPDDKEKEEKLLEELKKAEQEVDRIISSGGISSIEIPKELLKRRLAGKTLPLKAEMKKKLRSVIEAQFKKCTNQACSMNGLDDDLNKAKEWVTLNLIGNISTNETEPAKVKADLERQFEKKKDRLNNVIEILEAINIDGAPPTTKDEFIANVESALGDLSKLDDLISNHKLEKMKKQFEAIVADVFAAFPDGPEKDKHVKEIIDTCFVPGGDDDGIRTIKDSKGEVVGRYSINEEEFVEFVCNGLKSNTPRPGEAIGDYFERLERSTYYKKGQIDYDLYQSFLKDKRRGKIHSSPTVTMQSHNPQERREPATQSSYHGNGTIFDHGTKSSTVSEKYPDASIKLDGDVLARLMKLGGTTAGRNANNEKKSIPARDLKTKKAGRFSLKTKEAAIQKLAEKHPINDPNYTKDKMRKARAKDSPETKTFLDKRSSEELKAYSLNRLRIDSSFNYEETADGYNLKDANTKQEVIEAKITGSDPNMQGLSQSTKKSHLLGEKKQQVILQMLEAAHEINPEIVIIREPIEKIETILTIFMQAKIMDPDFKVQFHPHDKTRLQDYKRQHPDFEEKIPCYHEGYHYMGPGTELGAGAEADAVHRRNRPQ